MIDKIIDLERWLAIKNCEKVYKDKRFIKYIARERERGKVRTSGRIKEDRGDN